MYTPTQLEVIRVFGRKELKKWCLFYNRHWDLVSFWNWRISEWEEYRWFRVYRDKKIWATIKEILGCIPELSPDVFRLAKEKWFTIDVIYFWRNLPSLIPSTYNSNIPFDPSIPLLEQPESTLLEILKLVK